LWMMTKLTLTLTLNDPHNAQPDANRTPRHLQKIGLRLRLESAKLERLPTR